MRSVACGSIAQIIPVSVAWVDSKLCQEIGFLPRFLRAFFSILILCSLVTEVPKNILN